MTNAIAYGLLFVIVAILALDHWVFEWGLGLAAARRAVDLIGWVAFWR